MPTKITTQFGDFVSKTALVNPKVKYKFANDCNLLDKIFRLSFQQIIVTVINLHLSALIIQNFAVNDTFFTYALIALSSITLVIYLSTRK